MIIYKIILIAICCIISALILKSVKPEFSLLISLCGGIIILLMAMNMLGGVFSSFSKIVQKTGLNEGIFKLLLKVVGIGYLTQFTSDFAAEASINGISNYVVLAGKITILVLCFPIFESLLSLVSGLIK